MCDNLLLPICPKCNDTKNVVKTKHKTVKLVVNLGSQKYYCQACHVLWHVANAATPHYRYPCIEQARFDEIEYFSDPYDDEVYDTWPAHEGSY